ncbi:MAG: hydantoinase/oxoprolinase family protein [Alphaproteobacteria bacterium]|nr:hydantoinase/oxoprolinase family protein [Alphaproteobacteria bacterium]
MAFRVSFDTGGTFTDVVVADERGLRAIGKALTTPQRIFEGMRDALDVAGEEIGTTGATLLAESDLVIYGTTRATNAIVTGATAKTAFLTTKGFKDILLLKEGGKPDAHDYSYDYPGPYIPRRYSFEIAERIDSEGGVVAPLDENQARDVIHTLKRHDFEAVAVCLLWSIANGAHERALGRLIEAELPSVPYTLSHELVPILREYRRASATAIDASLKPLMQRHLTEMERDLRAAGFKGEILVSTSMGGCQHVAEAAARPILTLKSGPAMAPVAGRAFIAIEDRGKDAIVCDTGGTTFDVGLVRDGALVYTRDSWLGGRWLGHMISLSTVDVRSIGAGGGSIAWIDAGGLLCVGPQSAGALPGPACYGRGGTLPTVTDAAVVLGYVDPDYFNGGRIKLEAAAARRTIAPIAEALGRGIEDTAFAIMTIASELMIKAIHEITVSEGINPRESVIVAGGGAAGMNILPIARELGCATVILPKVASAMSASGMQFSDIVFEQTRSRFTQSGDFDFDGVNRALEEIETGLERFRHELRGARRAKHYVELFVEARYQSQVWELDTPLPVRRFRNEKDVAALIEAFHNVHDRVYAVRDEGSQVECVNWRGRISIALGERPKPARGRQRARAPKPSGKRRAFFGDGRAVQAPIFKGGELKPGDRITGPAIIEEATTTIVVYPKMIARVSPAFNYILESAS